MKTYRTAGGGAVALFLLLTASVAMGCAPASDPGPGPDPVIQVTVDEAGRRVDVTVDGAPFTSYLFGGGSMKKPLLHPIIMAGGTEVTRGYPLSPKAGERTDHPHHVGLWLNYGDVNGIDFWNNSDRVPAERAAEYGTIVHREVRQVESGAVGVLEAVAEWQNSEGDVLLEESTRYEFRTDGPVRMIDRVTTLAALEQQVNLTDNKEGMFALRVARSLELPDPKPTEVVGPDGEPVRVSDSQEPAGHYLNSEGVTDGDVWGKRAAWCLLTGEVEGEPVTIVMLDHPDNAGYPTYWHARGYGLFSANTLGQKALSDGADELNFMLAPGESTIFRYRVVLLPEKNPAVEQVQGLFDSFAGTGS